MKAVKTKITTPYMTLYHLKRVLLWATVFVFVFSQVNISYADETADSAAEVPAQEQLVEEVTTSNDGAVETQGSTEQTTETTTSEDVETTQEVQPDTATSEEIITDDVDPSLTS